MRYLVLTLLLGLNLQAQAADSSSGCGLGWQIFKKNSLVSSSARSITNAFTSNTLAMTLGTSGCARHDIVLREKAAQYYAEANFQKLQSEFAEGQGEHLAAFSQILGCFGDTGSAVQSQYETIFPANGSNPSLMLDQVKSVLRQNQNVACQI